MTIDAEQVRRIAHLARLDLDDGAVEVFRAQLARILDYVAALDTLEAGAVPPTDHVPTAGAGRRADDPVASLTVEEALDNAPASLAGHFAVPRVLKG